MLTTNAAWLAIKHYLGDDPIVKDVASFTGVLEEVSSIGYEETCDHHEIHLIFSEYKPEAKTKDLYYVTSSGCSCGARGVLEGPFETEEQAKRYVPEHYHDKMVLNGLEEEAKRKREERERWLQEAEIRHQKRVRKEQILANKLNKHNRKRKKRKK